MSTHPRRRLAPAIAIAIAGTLAGGALAGPAMAADDGDSPAPTVRKAGGHEYEYVTVRKAGGAVPDFVTLRKAGRDSEIGYIISRRRPRAGHLGWGSSIRTRPPGRAGDPPAGVLSVVAVLVVTLVSSR